MGIKWRKYQNLPFGEIPKEKRVKKREFAICQGGCNRYTPMNNMKYNLCSVCAKKWAYHGYECDVPNCDAVADGTIGFQVWTGDNKICCLSCYNMWRRMNFCEWDRFVEKRHLFFLRPESFVKALEEGIVQIVPKDKRIPSREVATCHHCNDVKEIDSPKYQLCYTCRTDLQFYGEVCGVCEEADANYWDLDESIYVCKPCYQRKNKYNISSFHIYKTQVMTIKECQICKEPVSHTKQKGDSKCSANIDHDHNTNITRGVICHYCNAIEGMIDKIDISAHAYATRLKAYLENPPLSKSWMQE